MQRKHFISVLFCSVAILASCTDVWEEHYQPDPQLNADETLWELIKHDPELDEFEKFLIATKYDSLLMKDRFYTVWAPVNGFAYNEANRELWEREFVQNHIANYSHVAGGKLSEDNFVTMLNGKYVRFENSKGKFTFKGLSLKSQNIPAKNGILHKIDGYADFTPNIWEQLAKETGGANGVDSLYQFLLKDYKREFDQYNSVPGPTIDGKLHYLDSVFTESNPWFYDLGELNREDSSYTMFALTNTAWNEMYGMASKYFNYATGYATGDSVRDLIVRELMCKNLVFSDKVNAKYRNGERFDTLYSNYKLYYGNRNPLAFAGDEVDALYNGAITKQMSNGTLHIVNQVNYDPIKCWHDTIRTEAEGLAGATSDDSNFSDANYDSEQVVKTYLGVDRDSVALYNSISGGAIASFAPATNPNAGVKMTFDVRNVLSAPYQIKIVTVPAQIINPADTLFIRPTMFYAQIAYGHEEDIKASTPPLKLARLETIHMDTITASCEAIDTIVLCPFDNSGYEYVDVPICEYEESSRFKDAKTQTKLSIEVIVPTKAGDYKTSYVESRKLLRENEILLGVAEKELLAAQEKYEEALENEETDPETLEEYLEEVEDCEKAVEKLLREIERNKKEVEKFSGGAKYDNVLRIDQVIFEPYNPQGK